MSESVSIENIRTDGGTQPRTHLYEETVGEYREALESGAKFPPVTVFHDGSDYWLADGFHRFHAYRQAGKREIPAEIHQGTRRDAVLYSAGANDDHGLRRTNEDKRNAVMLLLKDNEWSKWSDREVARRCGVDHKTVGKLRGELTGESPQSERPRTYTTRHGTQATMATGNIGRAQPKDEERIAPEAEQEPAEEIEKPERQPKSRGVGVKLAHEAISALKRIPLNDGLRQDAFSIVQDWIETNRGN